MLADTANSEVEMETNPVLEKEEREVILKTENLSKSFSVGGKQQHVLKNLNLEIREGEFTVIMGNSGSGKSTLLYCLSGMDKASMGEISYGSERIDGYSNDRLAVFRRKNCGFVFQEVMLNDNMSILDNVLVSGFLLKPEKNSEKTPFIEKIKELFVRSDRKAVTARAKELLREVGIEDEMFKKFPQQMSGGELQRVGLVRALVNDPKIVFADEPTGALNSANSGIVLNLFNQFNEKGKTVVMVTHDLKTASHGSRILYLKDGVILNELVLGVFREGREKERMNRLKDFLDEMGW